MSESYTRAWQESVSDPEPFWSGAAQAISWFSPPARAHDVAQGWFPGGMLNTCWNCVDRHVNAGRGDQAALIYDSPVTGTVRHYIYAQLQEEVGRAAAMLTALGVGKSDRVILYMPMIRPRALRCSPVPGSARSIRWCSAVSPRTNWPSGSTMPGRACC